MCQSAHFVNDGLYMYSLRMLVCTVCECWSATFVNVGAEWMWEHTNCVCGSAQFVNVEYTVCECGSAQFVNVGVHCL